MIHRLLTPATVEPVMPAEAKVACAVDVDLTEEDAHIEHLILFGAPFRAGRSGALRQPAASGAGELA